MTSMNVAETFNNFLESSKKIHDNAEMAIQRNEDALAVDLQDLNNYSEDLYVEISRNFSSHIERINKVTEVFSMKNFNRKIHNTAFFNNLGALKIRNLKSSMLGQLITFSGTSTRTSQVRPELTIGTFTCNECNATITDITQEFKYTEPVLCPNHLCTNRKLWKLDINQSKFSNWQKIHVQENTDEIPPGALPRNIDVIVRDDLVEKIRAGDKITFTGYLIVVPDIIQLMIPQSKSMPQQEGVSDSLRNRRNVNIKDLNYKLGFMCIYADYVAQEAEDFTGDEIRAINAIRNSDNLYYKLSQSLFPSIHGHFSIKNAILLMLAGGVSKKTCGDINLRGDINVLLVGDPGTAKSQFLRQSSSFLPRSVYTSGKSSSAAGLTACVIKDGETGEFSIEAGALMLSDNGVCCIDEFDKMNYKDQVSIHEAMEQQTITIAKAGINATLNARASILAAANPIKGRYDKIKTLKQNINLSAPIMSRFDLYFVLIDDVDEENDTNVATHILNNHQNFQEINIQGSYFPLEDVKLYLKYVRRLKPKIDDDCMKLLVEKYVKLRQESLTNSNNYKMTVRHLESMIRLSEALAKIHCDDQVRTTYVEEAYRLLQSSFVEIKGEDITISKGDDPQDNLVINSKDYARISNCFVYIIKSRPPMTFDELITSYMAEVGDGMESMARYEEEEEISRNVLRFLIDNEGILFLTDDLIYIHPNYDV